MNKLQIIQSHWIELGFEPSQPDENGWVDYDFLPNGFGIGNLEAKNVKNPETRWTTTFVRPKKLNGIEDNNNWTKIENENNLPKKISEYHVVYDFNTSSERIGKAWYHGSNKWNTDKDLFPKTTEEMNISHYQEIIVPNKLPLH